jgi:sigma-B regulation protein RsbU (phosphoserine phosphatase)
MTKKNVAAIRRAGRAAGLISASILYIEAIIVMGADSAGPAIGIIPNAHFKTTEAKLAPGDCLLFYTDGIIEVEARDGSQFGIEGLRESVRSNLDQSTESLLDAIVSDVCKFGDSAVLTDDACLVAAELSLN